MREKSVKYDVLSHSRSVKIQSCCLCQRITPLKASLQARALRWQRILQEFVQPYERHTQTHTKSAQIHWAPTPPQKQETTNGGTHCIVYMSPPPVKTRVHITTFFHMSLQYVYISPEGCTGTKLKNSIAPLLKSTTPVPTIPLYSRLGDKSGHKYQGWLGIWRRAKRQTKS